MINQRSRVDFGILGAGQLSLMLLEGAMTLGLKGSVLAESQDDPALLTLSRGLVGRTRSVDDLSLFLSQVPTVLFENEFVDVSLIRQACRNLAVPPNFFPSLNAIEILQNKLNQKKILSHLKVLSSRYRVIKKTEIIEAIENKSVARLTKQFEREFPNGYVIKWATLGYDGKGTWISGSRNRVRDLELLSFVENADKKKVDCFVEEKINFDCEIAVIAVRGVKGQVAIYPVVQTQQRDGICREVSPMAFPAPLLRQAKAIIEAILLELQYVGVLAVECFVSRDQIYVNELAPRVHNSGHFTQDFTLCSQFENHVRACLGFELGDTSLTHSQLDFVMVNLLGEKVATIAAPLAPPPFGRLHWYSKTELRVGRKMGHVNVLVPRGQVKSEVVARTQRWWDNYCESL